MASKRRVAGRYGVAFALIGVWLRIQARDLAWPKTYRYSGDRANTVWAITEKAYQDIALAFLIFGLVVVLVVVINWLWESSGTETGRIHRAPQLKTHGLTEQERDAGPTTTSV